MIKNSLLFGLLLLLVLLTTIGISGLVFLIQSKNLQRRWLQSRSKPSAREWRGLNKRLSAGWVYGFYQWHVLRWQKCGHKRSDALSRSSVWLILTLAVVTAVWLSSPLSLWRPLLSLLLLEGLFAATTTLQIRQRQSEFATGVYKIYRYLALQLTAGMTTVETVKHLHEAVDQPFMKEAVFSFSSCYFRTMNLDLAAQELTKRIEGDEIHVLAAVLRQGILTGDHCELIQKQEQLMLRRYYSALEAETGWIHAKGVCIAIGLCLLVFVLLALPMLYEMSRATQMIFI